MKRILIAGAFALAAGGQALAADLPPPMAPPPRAPATYVPTVVPLYNWGGLYIGINGGYAFGLGSNNGYGAPVNSGSFTTDGFIGGGTVGFNYQFGPFVLGAEGDGDWTNLKGSTTGGGCTGAPGGLTSCQTSANWLATFRGRAGYAFDRVLVFGTAGGAYGDVIATTNLGSNSNDEFGWTAGGGVEVAFAQNWTAKVEYLFVDLANGSCNATTCGGASTSVKFEENLVRGGVNFKFSF
jgi:outer membrane immunogenic protein